MSDVKIVYMNGGMILIGKLVPGNMPDGEVAESFCLKNPRVIQMHPNGVALADILGLTDNSFGEPKVNITRDSLMFKNLFDPAKGLTEAYIKETSGLVLA